MAQQVSPEPLKRVVFTVPKGMFSSLGVDLDSNVGQVLYVTYVWDKVPGSVFKDELNKIWLFSLVVAGWFLWAGYWLVSLAALLAAWVLYLLFSLKPKKLLFIIETKGVRINDELFVWENLREFWFSRQGRYWVLYISTTSKYPPLLAVVLDSKEVAYEITLVLGNFLPYRVVQKQSLWDRFTYGLYVPINSIVDITDLVTNPEKLKHQLERIIKASVKRYKAINKNKPEVIEVN